MTRDELERLLRECARLETEVSRLAHAAEQAVLARRAVERRLAAGIELARAAADWLGVQIDAGTWEVRS